MKHLILIGVVAALAQSIAVGQVYRCITAAGLTEYTDRECTGGATQKLTVVDPERNALQAVRVESELGAFVREYTAMYPNLRVGGGGSTTTMPDLAAKYGMGPSQNYGGNYSGMNGGRTLQPHYQHHGRHPLSVDRGPNWSPRTGGYVSSVSYRK